MLLRQRENTDNYIAYFPSNIINWFLLIEGLVNQPQPQEYSKKPPQTNK
jgi:hypothetical protein